MTETYEGKPCSKCGNTTRWASNNHCIKENSHKSAKEAERKRKFNAERRAKARANGMCQGCFKRPKLSDHNRCGKCREANVAYKRSIRGYIVKRTLQINEMRGRYQQQLEEVQKELKELENVIFKNK